MILKPLSREYWPRDASRPFARLALAFLGAPLAVGLALAVFALVVFWFNPNGDAATISAGRVAYAFLMAFYPLTALSAAPAVGLLWSLRWRSRAAWLLAGFVVGGAGAAAQAITSGMIVPVEVATFIGFGAVLMLAIRQIAGVRC